MYFINLNIHTGLIPKKVYHFDNVDIIIYPAKKKILEPTFHQSMTITGLIVKNNKEALTSSAVQSRVKDFIVFSNFILPSKHSVRWLTDYSFRDIEQSLQPIERLEEFINFNYESDFKSIEGIYQNLEIYGETEVFPHRNMFKTKVDFKELLGKFCSLEKDEKLKHQISLFALNINTTALLNKFYNNENLQISLMYSIVDSLIDEIDPDQVAMKACEVCGHEKKGRKNSKKRIRDFVSQLGFKGENADLLYQTLWEHFKIRNDFFHETKSIPLGEMLSDIQKRTGSSTIMLKDELKFGQGRYSGLMNVVELVQSLLIEKLKLT